MDTSKARIALAASAFLLAIAFSASAASLTTYYEHTVFYLNKYFNTDPPYFLADSVSVSVPGNSEAAVTNFSKSAAESGNGIALTPQVIRFYGWFTTSGSGIRYINWELGTYNSTSAAFTQICRTPTGASGAAVTPAGALINANCTLASTYRVQPGLTLMVRIFAYNSVGSSRTTAHFWDTSTYNSSYVMNVTTIGSFNATLISPLGNQTISQGDALSMTCRASCASGDCTGIQVYAIYQNLSDGVWRVVGSSGGIVLNGSETNPHAVSDMYNAPPGGSFQSTSFIIKGNALGNYTIACNASSTYANAALGGNQTNVTVVSSALNLTYLSAWDDSDFSEVYPGQTFFFWANYTNGTHAINDTGACNISINGLSGWTPWASMVFNSTEQAFQFPYSFTEPGNYSWNVSCSKPGFQPKQNSTLALVSPFPAVTFYEHNAVPNHFFNASGPFGTPQSYYHIISGGDNRLLNFTLDQPAQGNGSTVSAGTASFYGYFVAGTAHRHRISWQLVDWNGTSEVEICRTPSGAGGAELQIKGGQQASANCTIASDYFLEPEHFLRVVIYDYDFGGGGSSTLTHYWDASQYFSAYSFVAAPLVQSPTNLTLWDDSDYVEVYAGQLFSFWANYTSGSQALNGTGVCKISFNDSGGWTPWQDMSFNSDAQAFQAQHGFGSGGNYTWNVTCYKLGFQRKNASSTAQVSTAPYVIFYEHNATPNQFFNTTPPFEVNNSYFQLINGGENPLLNFTMDQPAGPAGSFILNGTAFFYGYFDAGTAHRHHITWRLVDWNGTSEVEICRTGSGTNSTELPIKGEQHATANCTINGDYFLEPGHFLRVVIYDYDSGGGGSSTLTHYWDMEQYYSAYLLPFAWLGTASVNITYPPDNATFQSKRLFNVTADITSSYGILRDCNATVSWAPAGLSLAPGENATKPLGDFYQNQTKSVFFTLNASAQGTYNITVSTSCSKGLGASDKAYNLTVTLAPIVYTDKASYASCGRVYYKVTVTDLNDVPSDANVTVRALNSTSSLQNETNITTGNGGTGVYLGFYDLPAGAAFGKWILQALTSSGSLDQANFYVGAGGTDAWKALIWLEPDSIKYEPDTSVTVHLRILDMRGYGIPSLNDPLYTSFSIDNGPNLASSLADHGDGNYSYSTLFVGSGPHYIVVRANNSGGAVAYSSLSYSVR